MQACAALHGYERSGESSEAFLGKGGFSEVIERWRDLNCGGWVAAKHVADTPTAEREVAALKLARKLAVPRVVQLKEDLQHPGSGRVLVLELLDGMTLRQYLTQTENRGPRKAIEERTMGTAAQLMETLGRLHQANMAHCDVTSANIMLTYNEHCKWDSLRLMDFGLSRTLDSGKGKHMASPLGATMHVASPEVLLAFRDSEYFYVDVSQVDAAAADVWAAGTCLYIMLTGQIPFVDENRRHEIEGNTVQDTLRAQCSWATAVVRAERTGLPVKHPLLDSVRACSTTPDAAADFFTAVLHPTTTKRLSAQQALEHVYLSHCVSQMRKIQQAQASNCISRESHSLACAPLSFSNAGPALPCSGSKFRSLQSVLSKLFPSPTRSKEQVPARSKPHAQADYFPDYTHPSSDAELLAEPDSVLMSAEPVSFSSQYQRSMEQLHSTHPSANVEVAPAVTGNATSEAAPHSKPRDADICSHFIEILPEDEEEFLVGEAESVAKDHRADKDICSHPVDILPEDEEEIWVAETKPSTPSIAVHASSVQGLAPPHTKDQQGMSHVTSPRIAVHPSPVQGPYSPRMKDQQGVRHNSSIHPVMSSDAGRPGFAPGSSSAQQEDTTHSAPDMTSVEEPPLAAPPRGGYTGSRTCETQAQRRGRAMRRFGKALVPLAGALVLAALRLAAPSSRF